jgi:hypothetical protein
MDANYEGVEALADREGSYRVLEVAHLSAAQGREIQ